MQRAGLTFLVWALAIALLATLASVAGAGGDTGPDPIGWAVIAVALIAYPLPALIAWGRSHPQRAGIVLLDLAFGWTGVLWLVALGWSMTRSGDAPLTARDGRHVRGPV